MPHHVYFKGGKTTTTASSSSVTTSSDSKKDQHIHTSLQGKAATSSPSASPIPTTTTTSWSMEQYFHAELRREFCHDILKEDGDFLLRTSKDNFVVSIRWGGQVVHLAPDYDGSTYRLVVRVFRQDPKLEFNICMVKK